MPEMITKVIMLLAIVVFDVIVFLLLRRSFPVMKEKRYFNWLYLVVSLLVFLCFCFLDWIFMDISLQLNRMIIGFIFLTQGLKLLTFIFLLLDNAVAAVQSYVSGGNKQQEVTLVKNSGAISRKKFLLRATLMAGSVPLFVKGFNIINQAYDYQVRRVKVSLPRLPKSFHGLKVAHISDIHSGSFKNKIAVGGGVDMLIDERPDLVFFTGDLVNRQTDEISEYFDVFKRVKAPLGVYSVLGNHDYGEYRSWPSHEAKTRDFVNMLLAHKELGWTLLRNQNHLLEQNGEYLAIMGVENWGVKRFSKYGKLEDAYLGTENAATRLLLSHDPSHWEAKVLDYTDIDMTFSGHTHGFQFGVEAGDFRWSPSQYLYKQWAGLYQKGSQYIYVNRGYGFIGMPGRVGIAPEITIVELSAV